MAGKVVGIDLGTSTSCCAVIEGGKPVVVANSEGGRTTPSVVSLKDGERKVGAAANRQRVVNTKETISLIKRFMGSEYKDCSEIISRVSYDVVDKGGKPRVVVDGREYSPEEISSFILGKMKKTAEDYVGETITDAVITCPAWFDANARESTKVAGEMCGLNVLRVINEPTAAILASNIDTKNGGKKVMVADIGGGTTDFSICDVSDGVVEVLASNGDIFLGGSDFDNSIAQYIVDKIKQENGVDITGDKAAMQRIIEAAEKAKIELGSGPSTDINIPYITVKDNTPVHVNQTLTKSKMEQLTESLVERIVECGRKALMASKLSNKDIDYILLVGGQSRSEAIQNALSKEFNVPLNKSVNPDEAVAIGAVIQANIIKGGEGSTDLLLLDVTPLQLGIETMGGVMTTLVEANTTIPCKKTQVFTTAVDNQSAVTINVLQGCRPLAKDNKTIGMFNLDGIMPAKRGVPQIEVSFDIDSNGILSVSAKDKATGKEQHVTIESKTSISKEEIERIKAEAEAHAAEDEATKKKMEKRNDVERMVYQTEQSLEAFKDNQALTDDDKTFFNTKLEELKKVIESDNFDNSEALVDEVQKRWYEVSARAYNQGSGDGSSQNPFGGFNFTGEAENMHQ